MTPQAIGANVLILPDKAPEQSEGGIYYSDKTQDKARPTEGTVVSVGPGLVNSEGKFIQVVNCKAGDRVIFRNRKSERVEIDGRVLHCVGPDRVLAVIDPPDTGWDERSSSIVALDQAERLVVDQVKER